MERSCTSLCQRRWHSLKSDPIHCDKGQPTAKHLEGCQESGFTPGSTISSAYSLSSAVEVTVCHPHCHPSSALSMWFCAPFGIYSSSAHSSASVFTVKALICPCGHAMLGWRFSQEHLVLLIFIVAVVKYPMRITLREKREETL